MKKILLILLSCVLGFYLSAEIETIDGIEWTYQVSNGEAQIYKDYWSPAIPSSTRGAIAIPVTLDDYPVTSIGEWAFYDCSSLTSVTIPEGVTSIGDEAFRGCSGLTSVTIPSSVTSIGKSAFRDCSGLTSITIPSSVTSIDMSAFANCSGLTSITFEDGSDCFLGACAFDGCTGVQTINLPGTFSYGGDVSAFGGVAPIHVIAPCYLNSMSAERLQSFTIPKNTTQIADNAFYSYYALPLVIPASVTYIGRRAFVGCTDVPSFTFEGVPPEVGADAFPATKGYYPSTYAFEWEAVITNGKWNNLTMEMYEVEVPSALTYTISNGEVTIAGCDESAAGALTIPSTIEGCPVISIGYETFRGCYALTSITIPPSVTSIGGMAFRGCFSLMSFNVVNGNSNYSAINGLLCSKDGKTLLTCPPGLVTVTIPEGVTSIGYYAFADCSGLTSVTIPEGVTSIGYYAFADCSGLTSVTIPEGVTSIDYYAFADCSGLTSVTFEGVPPEVGADAFPATKGYYPAKHASAWAAVITNGKWNNLTMEMYEVVVDPSVLTYTISNGEVTITDCDESAAGALTIPEKLKGYPVTSIGNSAFSGCTGLTSVTIPEGVVTIEGYAFGECSSLTSVTIPSSLRNVRWHAFCDVASERNVYISDLAAWCQIYFEDVDCNPCHGEGNLYLNDTLITDLVIPEGVTEINHSTFESYKKLTSVTIPEGVTIIGSAFRGCSSLTSVRIPSSVTSIEYAAFVECPNLESVTFSGPPPFGNSDAWLFSDTTGYYLPKHAEAWTEVINEDGKWCGLTMRCMEAGKLFTLTFEANGGEGGTSITQDYGSSLIAPTVTREGYTFIGWLPEVPTTVPATNATYTAQWRANQYTQTFDANGGEGGASLTQDYGSYLAAPTVIREGYMFTSWSPEVPTTVPAANATYMAQWQINQYTITFDAAGGEDGTSVTQDYGSSLTAPTVTREGYTFIGWSPTVPVTVPATNATYTAQWRANQYTQTFDAAGGEGGTSVTQDYGSSLTAPIVIREGYTFIGWSPNVPASIPSTDAIYVAQWRANQYTITFDVAGGEGGTSVTQDYGSSLTAPTVTREGYTFIGWSPNVPVTIPSTDATYVAQWRINQYTITFDAAGGEGGTSVTQDYGSSLTAPTVILEGYTFVGWLPEVPSITPAVNTTYVAQWAKVYNVTINCKGNGTVSGEGGYQPGASVVLTATPDEGVTFCGWAGFKKTAETTISFVMPEEDVVLSAYFAKSSALDAYLSTHENSGGDADDLDSLVEAEIAKRDLHTADEMKEMVVDTPVIEAKNGVVTIRLQVKDGAANEVMDGGEVLVEITPKAGEKAGFYKFVVPDEQ